jgi:ribosomal protein S18 acetylase RimI-like enzyme
VTEVRLATAADLAAVEALIKAAYARYLPRMDRPPAPMTYDYAAVIEAGSTWVAGDPVCGIITLHSEPDALLIENVAVHPSAQGTGIGRALMTFAEHEATRRGLFRLVLYTNAVMTENQAIYRHLGYTETSRSTAEGYLRVFMDKQLNAAG